MNAKVNLISREDGWIIRRAAKELLPLGCSLNGKEGVSDIDYYLPYTDYRSKHSNIQVVLFTHYEENINGVSDAVHWNIKKKQARFSAAANEADYCVAMCNKTASLINDNFKPRNKPWVIKMGSQFAGREIIFGVCGREYSTGRKNLNWVAELRKAGFVIFTWGKDSHERMLRADDNYRSIDYFVVTAKNEGGPVPMLEALSCGTPVIAPDVGWCWEYPVIRYERDCLDDLIRVMRGLTQIPSWEEWRLSHEMFFKKICKSVSLPA